MMMQWHIVLTKKEFLEGTPLDTSLYFIQETGEIYRGNRLYNDSVIMYTGELPNISNAANNILYVNSETLEGKTYDGTAWRQVLRPIANSIIADGSGIPSAGLVYDFVVDKINEALNSADIVNNIEYDAENHLFDISRGDGTVSSFVLTNVATGLIYNKNSNTLQLVDADGTFLGEPIILKDAEPDNASIETNENGKLSIKSFGKQYYKFHEADKIIEGIFEYPDHMPHVTEEPFTDNTYCKAIASGEETPKWYKYNTEMEKWELADHDPAQEDWYELVNGWIAGLSPKVVSVEGGTFAIAWYEPSTTTVEGIADLVSTLQTEVQNLTTRQGEFEARLAEIEEKGATEVDDVTIGKHEETGVIFVKGITTSLISDFEEKLDASASATLDAAKAYTDEVAIAKTDLVNSENIHTNVEDASDTKPVSEKALVKSMSWILGM